MRHGLEHPPRTSSRTRSPPRPCSRRCARPASPKIAFSSTGSVYGEPEVFPTPEDAPFPVQTSLYAASKLAGEGLIGAYAARLRLHRARLPLRLDPRRALHARPRVRLLPRAEARSRPAAGARRRAPGEVLPVRRRLRRRRSCTAVGAHARGRPASSTSTTSAPTRRSSSTTRSRVICGHLGVEPELEYAGGRRGWAGDSPLIHLDCTRIRALGWEPTLTHPARRSSRTLDWFDANPYAVADRRPGAPSR